MDPSLDLVANRLPFRLARHAAKAARAEQDRDWFAATFHLQYLIAGAPEKASLYARRAQAYAERNWWPQAVADFSRACQLDQKKSSYWLDLLLCKLSEKNDDAYQSESQQLAARFRALNDPQGWNDAAWGGLLIPPSDESQLATLVELAERAVVRQPTRVEYRITLGLARFRQNRYQDAIDVLSQTPFSQDRNAWITKAALLAMAFHALGDEQHAAVWRDQLVEDQLGWQGRIIMNLLKTDASERDTPQTNNP
jgi:tetratricopeptide (TPR) repeat protein